MSGDSVAHAPSSAEPAHLAGRELALLTLAALAVRLLALPARAGAPPEARGASDAVATLVGAAGRLLPEPAEAALRVRELFGDPDPALVAVRVLLVLLGTLAVPVLAAAGARLGGHGAGLLAGALLAVTPFVVESSFTLGPAALLLIGASFSLAGLTRVARGEGGDIAAGAGAGLALAAGGGGGLGLLAGFAFAREDSPRASAGRVAAALVSAAAVFALLSPASLASFPRLPGVAPAAPAQSPLLSALVAVFAAAGPLVVVLAVVGKLDLLRRRPPGTWAVLLATAGAFLVPVVRHGAGLEPLAGALPGIFLLAGVAATGRGLSGVRRGAALVAVGLAVFAAGSFLVSGFVRTPAEAATEWILRELRPSEVLLVESGGPRLRTVEGVIELRALAAAGALTPAEQASYAPAGKVFQPVPLPPAGTAGREATLFYDPNLVQFFRWIVLRDPVPDWRESRELVTVRSVFHEYFAQDWEAVARFEPGLSRRPGITVLRRRDDFTQLDRARLAALTGILGTSEAEALRQSSDAYLDWLTSAGIAFRRVNELIAAGRFLDFASLLAPDRFEPVYQYALVELQREKPGRAKELLLRALLMDSDHGGVLYNLGTVLEAEGDTNGAAIQYAAAIFRLEDPTPAHARLGALLVRSGQLEEAREHLEAIRRLDPGGEAEQFLAPLLGSP